MDVSNKWLTIVLADLVVGLGSSGLLYTQVNSLQNQIISHETSITQLEDQVSELEANLLEINGLDSDLRLIDELELLNGMDVPLENRDWPRFQADNPEYKGNEAYAYYDLMEDFEEFMSFIEQIEKTGYVYGSQYLSEVCFDKEAEVIWVRGSTHGTEAAAWWKYQVLYYEA